MNGLDDMAREAEANPRIYVQQVGHRWETWVQTGLLTRYAGEYGTYAWTERRAEAKGRKLLAEYLSQQPRNRREVTA